MLVRFIRSLRQQAYIIVQQVDLVLARRTCQYLHFFPSKASQYLYFVLVKQAYILVQQVDLVLSRSSSVFVLLY